MSTHTHDDHSHEHKKGCGHTAIEHDGHIDYLHDGHLHHPSSDGQIHEHTIAVSTENPEDCTEGHTCSGHDSDHDRGARGGILV